VNRVTEMRKRARPRRDRRARYLANLTSMVVESRRFELTVDDPASESNARDEDPLHDLARRVLLPLARGAERCRIFKYEEELVARPGIDRAEKFFPQRDRWIADYVHRSRGEAEVDLAANGVLDDAPFWAWVAGGGTRTLCRPVLVTAARALEDARLFDYAVDPEALWNLSAVAPRSALAFAKRHATASDRVALIFSAALGWPFACSLVAVRSRIGALFEAAVRRGRFTTGHLELYAR
jgi:hypothetical protein